MAETTGRPSLRPYVPDGLHELWGPLEAWQLLGLVSAGVLAVVLAWVVQRLLLAVARRAAALTTFKWDDELVSLARGPLSLLLASGLLTVLTPLLDLPKVTEDGVYLLARSV